MNERIKELADQAGFIRFKFSEDPRTPIDWSCDYSAELDKFAELIVQECIAKVEETPFGYIDYRSQIEHGMRSACAYSIKYHLSIFGVDQ